MIIRYISFLLILQSFNTAGQSVMLGAGGTYGTDVEQFGINTRLYYGLNEEICFGPEFSFFPAKANDVDVVELYEIGFVVHYIFEIKEKIGVYPLIGINYSAEESKHSGLSHSKNAFGASFGGGMHLQVKNFMPFLEYKYITGDLSQSTFSLGLIYNLKFVEE